MSKQTEAIKLALEALLWANNEINDWRDDSYGYEPEDQPVIMSAITALREALAEQPAQQEPVLQEIEQYRLQMAGISTAAIGYWKEGDGIHSAYDTVALRDVAKLYAKYDELYRAQPAQQDQEACPTCGEYEPRTGTCGTSPNDKRALCNRNAPQPAQPQQEPMAYIRKDQLQKAAQSPMLCEVTPEPRQDRIGIYTFPPAQQQEPVAWLDEATHYQPQQKAFYKRVSATEWYIWSRVEQEPLHWCMSLGTSDGAHWILRQPAQHDNSDDLTIAYMAGLARGKELALEGQPAQQEPVAYASAWFALVMNAAAELEDASNCLRDEDAKRVVISGAKYYRDAAKNLYISPPAQRTWVGLTVDEIEECYSDKGYIFARAIEAKLKEKNT